MARKHKGLVIKGGSKMEHKTKGRKRGHKKGGRRKR